MEALHTNLVGEKDSLEAVIILESVRLKLTDVECWNETVLGTEDHTFNEALRFAERFGIFAQYLSENSGKPVGEIAKQAFDLADDKDIRHMDHERGDYVFVYAVWALAQVSDVGKDLRNWCKETGSPGIKEAFDHWDDIFATQLIAEIFGLCEEDVDGESQGNMLSQQTTLPLNDAWSKKVVFDSYLNEDGETRQNVLNALRDIDERKTAEFRSFLNRKQRFNAYLEMNLNDGVSEKIKDENKKYLAQEQDNLGCLPTCNDAWISSISEILSEPVRNQDELFGVDATTSKASYKLG